MKKRSVIESMSKKELLTERSESLQLLKSFENFIDCYDNNFVNYQNEFKKLIKARDEYFSFFERSLKFKFIEETKGIFNVIKDTKIHIVFTPKIEKQILTKFSNIHKIIKNLSEISNNLQLDNHKLFSSYSIKQYDYSNNVFVNFEEVNLLPFGQSYGDGLISEVPKLYQKLLIPKDTKEEIYDLQSINSNPVNKKKKEIIYDLESIKTPEKKEKKLTTKVDYSVSLSSFTDRSLKFLSKLDITPNNLCRFQSKDFLTKKYFIKCYDTEKDKYQPYLRTIEICLRKIEKRKVKTTNSGYVYVLTNKSLPENVYKIGSTYGLPEERAEELTGTGHIEPFKVIFKIKIINAEYYEKSIHKIFQKFRVKKNREFFKTDIQLIKDCLNIILKTSEGEKKKLNLSKINKQLI